MERDWIKLMAARAALVDLEYKLLRAPPQIALEILLCVFMAGEACDISAIYANVRATEAAVRRHMRQLERQGVIAVQRRPEDKRKATVRLTARGLDLKQRYLAQLLPLMESATASALQMPDAVAARS